MPSALVIGAGAAGLSAAQRLHAAGVDVSVVDKGRGVGGRLATRRIGAGRLDHGAQFFTTRSEELSRLAGDWVERGVAREWCRGFGPSADGHPRFVGATGMTGLAKDLAEGLNVRTSVRLAAVAADGDGRWRALTDDGRPLTDPGGRPLAVDAVIATPPAPQTLDLVGPALGDGPAVRALEWISYEPTLAALLVLSEPCTLPAPGGVQLGDGVLSWIGDNQAKSVSEVPAVTIHASGDTSALGWDDDPRQVLDRLEEAARPHIGPAPATERQLARWLYATPKVAHVERCLVAVDGPRPLVCAGDAFGEARVEGAVRSGWAAGEAVLERIVR